MSGTAPPIGLAPAPLRAPVSGSMEMRLQQIADVITQNMATIAVLRNDMNVSRREMAAMVERIAALERDRAE